MSNIIAECFYCGKEISLSQIKFHECSRRFNEINEVDELLFYWDEFDDERN